MFYNEKCKFSLVALPVSHEQFCNVRGGKFVCILESTFDPNLFIYFFPIFSLFVFQSPAESRASNSAQADAEQQQQQQQQQQHPQPLQQQQAHSSHQQQVITAAIEQGESSRQVKNSNVQSLSSASYRFRFEPDTNLNSGWKESGPFYMDANGRSCHLENPTPGTAQLNAGPGGLRLADYLSRDAQPRTNS